MIHTHEITLALSPIWTGILMNVLFCVVNGFCIGHYGKIASGWMRYSPFVLGASWLVLIGIATPHALRALAQS